MENKKKLLLVDGSSVAYRAFFALYNQIDRFKNRAGLHTSTIYGFHLMLNYLLERVQPAHVLVTFDAGRTTFRTEMYKDYKAGRAKTPDEFRKQLPYIREMLSAFGITLYDLENYEADDIIGTLDKLAENKDKCDVTIVSGDKDFIQLADSNTTVEISKKGVAGFEEFTPAYLMEETGITPKQFIDLKALMGDKSDNISDVTKIGEKTGLKLLLGCGSLKGVYENIDGMKKPEMKENLINDKEQALLSKILATINISAPITTGLDDISYRGPDLNKLIPSYDGMGFKQFKGNLGAPRRQEEFDVSYIEVDSSNADMFTDDQFFYSEILGDNYHVESIIDFAWGNDKAIYVSTNLDLLKDDLFEAVLAKPIKTCNLKYSKVLLSHLGIDLPAPASDSRLAKYLLSTVDDNELSTIVRLYTDYALDNDEAAYGKGVKRVVPKKAVLFSHLARKITVLNHPEKVILDELTEHQQTNLLFDIEQPLASVLARMEIAGISVKKATLQEMEASNQAVIGELIQEIYDLVGMESNIDSPKQLGELLFDKMQLPTSYTKKTKTGYSTAVDVLERLAPISPAVSKILEYRQIAKLQSTYIVGLQDFILQDGKIHTRCLQDLTQTGRLSSVGPNLQNIPVRLEQGRLIRKAFVPETRDEAPLSSDYSQIELRVLAHISNSEYLIATSREGADIRTSTAIRVSGIEKTEDVTPNDRRNAKAVNFGIVYGISDYGLANNLGTPRKVVKQHIEAYSEHYPGIKNYIEHVVRDAKGKGYVETPFHRRRELPDINSRNFDIRQFAERTAINSSIQGSTASILKITTINLDKVLVDGQFKTKMLLQVHDEIILQVPKNELEAVKTSVKETMESAIDLSIPLIVDENAGQT